MRRSRTIVAVLVAVAAALSGCSVPDDGWVGIGRRGDGELRVYLRTCHHPVDGATLYWPDDPAGDSEGEVFGEWEVRSAEDGPAELDWPLLGPSSGTVHANRPVQKLPEPPKNMGIYAWTRDASTSASGPFFFTKADIDGLEPGQILLDNNTGNESDPPNRAINRAAFDALDCADFG